MRRRLKVIGEVTSWFRLFRPRERRVRAEACRSASAGFLLFLPLLPVPCGRSWRAACPLRKGGGPFPGECLPAQDHQQSSLNVAGTLRISAFRSSTDILTRFASRWTAKFGLGWRRRNAFGPFCIRNEANRKLRGKGRCAARDIPVRKAPC